MKTSGRMECTSAFLQTAAASILSLAVTNLGMQLQGTTVHGWFEGVWNMSLMCLCRTCVVTWEWRKFEVDIRKAVVYCKQMKPHIRFILISGVA